MTACLLSFDVEDWFHVERFRTLRPQAEWSRQPLRVDRVMDRLLDLLARQRVRATFFVLGWVAERCPALVRRIAAAGHEVASHGYGHEPLPVLGPAGFVRDLRRGKAVLEDLLGTPVVGYRAPTFSMTTWGLPVLRAEGFLYDSSFFPGAYAAEARALGMKAGPGLIASLGEGLWEVEIPSLALLGRRLPWGGSGYFRILPYAAFEYGVRRILRERGQFVFYMHPWELDPAQPRVRELGWRDRFRQYHGLRGAERKLARLLGDFNFEPIRDAVGREASAQGRAA
jgi:polysaccharide deacetylase family protein (PEP-CTERM system associated)